MVMLPREALHRLCEQSLNNDFAPQQILDTSTAIIEAAIKIVETGHAEAQERRAEAMTQQLRLRR